jgi:hypothetical protein
MRHGTLRDEPLFKARRVERALAVQKDAAVCGTPNRQITKCKSGVVFIGRVLFQIVAQF